MEQIHSYTMTEAVIMNSGFWFPSELLDIRFLFNLRVPVLNLPPGLLSTCNNHTAADSYIHSTYGCYIFFQKTPDKYLFPGTSPNGD